jgi:hypothetical protein
MNKGLSFICIRQTGLTTTKPTPERIEIEVWEILRFAQDYFVVPIA